MSFDDWSGILEPFDFARVAESPLFPSYGIVGSIGLGSVPPTFGTPEIDPDVFFETSSPKCLLLDGLNSPLLSELSESPKASSIRFIQTLFVGGSCIYDLLARETGISARDELMDSNGFFS